MTAPVCFACQVRMVCAKTGIDVELMASAEPYQVWNADLFECPACGFKVVSGFGKTPIAEHFQRERYERQVLALSAGKAKVDYWYHVREAWPDIPFTAVRVRSIRSSIVQTDSFRRTAAYRGVTFARLGMRVQVGNEQSGIWNGVIVGNNPSANFDVLFLDGKYAGQTLNCHPNHLMKYLADDGTLIHDSEAQ